MGNSQTLHQMRGVTVEDLRQFGFAGLARLGRRTSMVDYW